MKLWVDDLRPPPDDSWVWLKTSMNAIVFMSTQAGYGGTGKEIEIMSLDHDLGLLKRGTCTCGEVNKENTLGHADGCRYFADSTYDTTRPVVIWMIENDFWPDEVLVHSANPVGVEWLEGMIKRYKPYV